MDVTRQSATAKFYVLYTSCIHDGCCPVSWEISAPPASQRRREDTPLIMTARAHYLVARAMPFAHVRAKLLTGYGDSQSITIDM